jgi:hypothetical protein
MGIYKDATTRNKYWVDSGTILIPRVWNADSIRCEILAYEHKSYPGEILTKADEKGETELCAVRFQDIKSWKEFNVNDSPLYVNWAVMTRKFKNLAFNAQLKEEAVYEHLGSKTDG